MMETMVAKCIGLRYEEGGYYTSQRVKNGTGIKKKGDYTMYPQGNGWAKHFKGSKLVLYISIDGKSYGTWVDRYFKENVGRLTDKRLKIIEKTMPKEVEVVECEGSKVGNYYIVSDESLDSWLRETGL